MTRTGPKPSTTNTFRSDAGNATNTVIFSESALSILLTKKGTQKAAKTRTALHNQQGKEDKEEESNQPK
jgi:hypothetical protein